MKKTILVILLYTLVLSIITLVFTYPLITDLNHIVYGFRGDNFGSIWWAWWLKFSNTHQLPFDFTSYVNAPFGEAITPNVVEFLWVWPYWLLSLLTNELFAFNILNLLSFPLSGLSMGLLVWYLTRNKYASFFAGIAFAFAPYRIWQGYVHVSLALTHWIPIYILALLYFTKQMDQGKLKNLSLKDFLPHAFLALSMYLVTLTTFYYGYFMALLSTLFFLAKIFESLITRRKFYLDWYKIRNLGVVLLIFVVLISPFLYKAVFFKKATTVSAVVSRPINDLLSLSTRPWDFLIPAPNHILWGTQGQEFYKNSIIHLTNDYKSISAFLPERVLYISFTVALLGLVGILFGLKNPKTRSISFILLFVFVGLLIISGPPFIIVKGLTIYLPSFYLYQLIPYFRAYVRLGIVLDVIALIFASFTINKFTNKSIKVSTMVTLVLTGLVIFEFLPVPGSNVTDLRNTTKVYEWVKKIDPGDIILEYPANVDLANALLFQRDHQHKLYNSLYEFTTNKNHLVTDAFNPSTMAVLYSLRVRYIIVHLRPMYSQPNPIDDLSFTRYTDESNIPKLLETVYSDKWVRVVKIPEYPVTPAGIVAYGSNTFEWADKNTFTPESLGSDVYVGNFKDTYMDALVTFSRDDVELNYPSTQKIGPNTYRVLFKYGWNSLNIRTPNQEEVKIEISDFRPAQKPL